MADKEIEQTWRAAFGGKKKPEATPFDGQEFVDPREFNEWLQKPCAKCGLPTIQQFAQVSHRGNFRHGGSKLTVRPIGKVCICKELAANTVRSMDALTDPQLSEDE